MIKLSRRLLARLRTTSSCVAIAGLIGLGAVSLSTPASAQSVFSTIYTFAGGTDGFQPQSGMTADSEGNFYGTTSAGGAYFGGTVFELSPDGNGGWTHKVILSLNGFKDGGIPYGQLSFDSQGNLYGTCESDGFKGNGAVFQLVKDQGGKWKLGRHYHFASKVGRAIMSGVVVDSQGNVFGTSHLGGAGNEGAGSGTVYELSPGPGDTYVPTVLHRFNANSPDGGFPDAGVIFGQNGVLIGASQTGGAYDRGYAFEMRKNDEGRWSKTDIHDFNPAVDGASPDATMVMDSKGNVYGTTNVAPSIVYELSPPAKGAGHDKAPWTETTLYTFTDNGGAGALALDPAGNLLGTSGFQGAGNGGYVYELSPTQSGPWAETVLYNLDRDTDGWLPLGPLIVRNGALYGTTTYGPTGPNGDNGTIFSLTY